MSLLESILIPPFLPSMDVPQTASSIYESSALPPIVKCINISGMAVETAQPLPDIGYTFIAYPSEISDRTIRIIVGTLIGATFLLIVIMVIVSVILRRSPRAQQGKANRSELHYVFSSTPSPKLLLTPGDITPAIMESGRNISPQKTRASASFSPFYRRHTLPARESATYTSPLHPHPALSLSPISPADPSAPAPHQGRRSKSSPPSYVSSPMYRRDPDQGHMSTVPIPPLEEIIRNLVEAHSACIGHPTDPRSLPRPSTPSALSLPEYTDSDHGDVICIEGHPQSWPAGILHSPRGF